MFTNAFDFVYLAVAGVAGGVLVALTARFLRTPTAQTAWAGYKFSGVYLTLVLIAIMVDAIVRIPV